MSSEVIVKCDGHGCCKEIDSNGASDDVQQLIDFWGWHNDPTTDEFHYCKTCWPDVQAEHDEMLAKNGEITHALKRRSA